jgi:ribosomal protein S10
MKKSILTIILASALSLGVNAQVKLPQASSLTEVRQAVGIRNVTLKYSRPNTNGRVVFGELVPYGTVWRTGANTVSAFTFEEEVSIGGKKIPAGTYGLLTIPNKNEWTIILSKNSQQWGSYTYKQEEDAVRFTVKPISLPTKVETFTISFDNVTTKSSTVTIAWEKTAVKFDINVDQSKEILASIDQAMLSDKKPYFQAAQYYFSNNLDIKKAAEWVVEADKGNTEAPWIKYWKSQILLKSGDKKAAQQAAQEGLEIAQKSNNEEYIKLNTNALNNAKK